MTSVVEEARGLARDGLARSVREVCLVGGPPTVWRRGDHVVWAGRVYRVTADQEGRYAHVRDENACAGR